MLDPRIRSTLRALTAPVAQATLAALAAAALLSVGFANSTHLAVVDSGVDYTNHDLEQAFIGMEFHDGWLVFIIDDEAFEGSMPAIAFDVPDLEKEDFFGKDIGAELTDIDELSWSAVGADRPDAPALHGVTYRHPGVTLDAAVAMYLDAFTSLGFEGAVADSASQAVKTATFTHGEDAVRIRFHSIGHEIEVELTTL